MRLVGLQICCALSLGGCVLGSEEPPGCRPDRPGDCRAGYTCRAGGCFRFTTDGSAPVEAAVEGSAGDANDGAALDATVDGGDA